MAILLKNRDKLKQFLDSRKWVKLKGSTLVETLVATVLIVTIFSIASLALNTIFKSVIQKRLDQNVSTRLYELKYLYRHEKIGAKHQEAFNNWTILISKITTNNQSIVTIEATEKATNKIISKQFVNGYVE